MGYTETSLQEHVTSEHAETSTEVVSTPRGERELPCFMAAPRADSAESRADGVNKKKKKTRGYRLFSINQFVSLLPNQTNRFAVRFQ